MPTDFGKYEIISEIGRGGMGIVYQALDQANSRMVAIKQLVLESIDPTKHREFKDRFRREAAMAARLDHPNIVTVFDVEAGTQDNNTYYYVMEFLEGQSLRKELELRGGKMTPEEYHLILKQVAEGLAYAHSLNVVHRDVKPDNIFIMQDGRVKLTDFGIARTVDYEQTHLTKTGVMLGTLAYVSPEQLQDAKNVDHRADIFSLGVVSYESLCGKLPFTGEGIAATVIKILSSEAESLHILQPAVSAETAGVVSKAIRKKARDRYMSVIDFSREFERSLTRQSLAAQIAAGQQPPTITNLPISIASGEEAKRFYTPGIPIDLNSLRPDLAQSQPNAKAPAQAMETAVSQPTAYYLVKPIGSIGRHGEGPGCFMEPSVVAVRSGRIVVADTVTRRVQIFSRDGRFIKRIEPDGNAKNSRTNGGGITTPSGLAIDFRGRIFASDSSDHVVRVFDPQGNFQREFVNNNGKDGGLQGLVVDSTGLLYASDVDNACLQVFQSDLGTWMRKVGVKGSGLGQIRLPSGLAVDRLNQVYVVDYGMSRISVYSKAGQFIRSFGGKGTGNGMFNVPRGIAVDKHDRIYVSDSLNHRVQVFAAAGEWLYSFGGRGAEMGMFTGPAGMSIDPETNCLYIADRGNHRIQIFELLAT
jgi:serine/threonine protein kinase/DNA-binding beta-propeller fold protein YncE